MNNKLAWEKFEKTGKISDYLQYKSTEDFLISNNKPTNDFGVRYENTCEGDNNSRIRLGRKR